MKNLKTVAYLYSKAFEYVAREGTFDRHVAPYDSIVISGGGQHDANRFLSLKQRDFMERKIYRYLDWWGASYWKKELSTIPRWINGPGDWGTKEGWKTASSPYLYRLDGFHVLRMIKAMFKIANKYPNQAGLFLDDFNHDKGYWRVPADIRRVAWPKSIDGGWDWVHKMQRQTEYFTRAILAARGQKLVVNGEGRSQAGPRLWESVGKWINTAELLAGAMPGDHVLVKGIAPDRESWITTTRPEGGYPIGTSFQQVFRDVAEICQMKDLHLGLCLEDNPHTGGSSATTHIYSDPNTWMKI
jgi:hypothetical protein